MEGSNPLLVATPEAVPPNGAEGETPFSRQYVWLTKQEHIELKSRIAFWKAQHARALEREQALQKELEEARAEFRDLRQRLYGRKSEKAAPRDDRTFTGGEVRRARAANKKGPKVMDARLARNCRSRKRSKTCLAGHPAARSASSPMWSFSAPKTAMSSKCMFERIFGASSAKCSGAAASVSSPRV